MLRKRAFLPQVALLVLVACGGKPTPTAVIDEDTWVVLRNSGTAVADAVMPVGRSGVFVHGDPVAFTQDFLLQNPATFGIRDAAQLAYDGDYQDDLGLRTFSFHQEVQGIPVYGAAVAVTYDDNDELLTVLGAFEPGATAPPGATVTPAEAITRSSGPTFLPSPDPSRVKRTLLRAPAANATDPDVWELNYLVEGVDAAGNPGLAFVAGTGEFRGAVRTSDDALGSGTGIYKEALTFPITEEHLVDADATPYTEYALGTDAPPLRVYRRSFFRDVAGGPLLAADAKVTASAADGWADPLALSAYANLVESHGWFARQLAPAKWGRLTRPTPSLQVNGPLPAAGGLVDAPEVLGETCGNASWGEELATFVVKAPCRSPVAERIWDPATRLERVGASTAVIPAIADFDFIAHEYTHRVYVPNIVRYDASVPHPPGQKLSESGVVAEAVADAFALFYAHDRTNNDAMPLELGARATQPARALRSYENPNLGFLGQPRTMAEAYVGTPNANGTVLWKDNAGAHANLGIANQALGILLRGPAIHGLDMTLDAPLPWSDVKRLYLPLLTERAPDEADVPKGVWTLHGMAVSMRRTAEKAKMDVGAVLCAWAAVGVLSPKDLGKFDTSRCHGFVPTTVSPPKSSELCKGRSDGVYCSADVAIGAIACVGGTAKAGRQCPSRSVCDPRMDGDSDIRCYNPCEGRADGTYCLTSPTRPDLRVTVACSGAQTVDTKERVCAPPATVDAGTGGADAGVEEGAPRADATCALGSGRTSGNPLAAGFLALALALASVRRSGRPGGRSSIAPRRDDLG
jgi:hypothetical protein